MQARVWSSPEAAPRTIPSRTIFWGLSFFFKDYQMSIRPPHNWWEDTANIPDIPQETKMQATDFSYPATDYTLTTKQAAYLLNCTVDWVRKLARRGTLESLSTPYGRLFSQQDIVHYATEKRHPGRPRGSADTAS